MKQYKFREGDEVIIMSVEDIKEMLGARSFKWREVLSVDILPGLMESMCDGKTVRVIEEINPNGNLFIGHFFFPPEILKPIHKRETPKIRLIRR